MTMPIAGETSLYKIVQSLRELWQLVRPLQTQFAWQSYTPTYTWAAGGTPPTVTTNSAKYVRVGQVTWLVVDFTITNLNGGSGNLDFTLPVNTNGAVIMHGREVALSGYHVAASQTGATAVRMVPLAPGAIAVNHQFYLAGFYSA